MDNTTISRKTVIGNCHRVFVLTLLLALLAGHAYSQNTSSNPLDGYTPTGLAPGAPVGSYALSGFDTINPYSGGMSFNLPLLSIGGRGSAGYTIRLPIEQKWTVTHSTVDGGVPNQHYDFYDAEFNTFIAGTRAGYGPGSLYGRQVGSNYIYCDYMASFVPTKTLTRFTFVTPDGTEYDLRDVQTDGHPFYVGTCAANGTSRGRVFKTADGSSATFISDQAVVDQIFIYSGGIIGGSGYLLLRDGTRYRIDGGTVTWMADRNGNKLTFGYNNSALVSSIKDSLNREVTIEYNVQDVAPYGLCDRITYKGFDGATRVIRVSYDDLANVLRGDSSMKTCHELFPLGSTSSFNSCSGSGSVVSAVWLPDRPDHSDRRSYKFHYNSYSELARVDLPTGGAFEYDWAGGFNNGPDGGAVCYDCVIYRRATERRVYSNGVDLNSRITFSRPDTLSGGFVSSSNYVEVDQYDSSNALTTAERHYYYGHAFQTLFPNDPVNYPDWQEGKEYQTDSLDSNDSTVLRSTANVWDKTNPTWSSGPASNPRVVETDTTLEPSGANQVTKQTFSYDQYNNRTDVYEYDYGSGTPGALLRHSKTDFLTTNGVNSVAYDTVNPSNSSPSASLTIHVRSLPEHQFIYDGGGVERARTTFEYDNYTVDANHAALVDCPNISGHDSASSTSYSARGNATATSHYFLTSGSATGSISAFAQYDIAGNLVKAIDPRGYAATFNYGDKFGSPDNEAESNTAPLELSTPGQASYAFATSVTNALNQTAHMQFDYHLGRSVNAEDANGVVTGIYSDANESLDRPTKVIRAANNNDLKNESIFTYDDIGHVITVISDQTSFNDNNPLKSQTVYDGLGRTTEKRQYESSTAYITVRQTYDDLGRSSQTSNPFRSNETILWTTTAYDALSRVISVTTPDAAVVNSYYNANQVMVRDQAGKERMSQTNALGQLTDVWEITGSDSATESISFPGRSEMAAGYRSKYEYSALGNLTTVIQQIGTLGTTQTRSFVYDSLSRLTSTANPESGTIGYQYDDGGNLKVKTDARGVSSHYDYDELNRVMRRWYNGRDLLTDTTNNSPTLPSGVAASDEIKYTYDSQSLPSGAPSTSSPDSYSRGYSTGRLVAVTYGGASAGDYYGYDALGRPVLKIQQTGSVNYQTSASYNLASGVISETYPSSHTTSYGYDGAGRTNSFTGYLGDGSSRNYATGITYSALGGPSQEQFGTQTPIYNKLYYNTRGQLAEIREGTEANNTSWNRGAIINHYSNQSGCSGASCSATDNNGNLMRQEYFIPTVDVPQPGNAQYAIETQYFDYDPLNRLKDVYEYSSWKQQYTYDRFGNRTIDQENTTTGIPKPNFGVDTTNNRLTAPAGFTMSYDPAGNLTFDNSNGSQGERVYDAESRITSARGGVSAAWQYYVYDGEGKRIRRNVDGIETWQIYGLGGEALAEYPANAPPSSPQKEYGYRNGQLLITANTGSASAPSGLSATPASNANITLNWSGASGATNYRIERRIANGLFGSVGTTASTTLTDTGSVGTAYLYRICAADGAGNCTSAYSNVSLAAPLNFPTDPVITSMADDPTGATVTYMKLEHITELRSAVNAVRHLAGKADATWTHPSLVRYVSEVSVDDVRDLRIQLDDALTALGIPTPAYTTDPTLKGFHEDPLNATPIKAAHIRELRTRATSGNGTGGGGGVAPTINWVVTDQLGTPRMIFDQTGAFDHVSRHDYLPFGEELFAGGRTTSLGYTNNDGTRQKFTGYERDSETSLDFAQARHYSSGQGRFTRPDPMIASADEFDPQSWNRYSYVDNNPLNLTDPLGLYNVGGGTEEDNSQDPVKQKRTEPYPDQKNIIHNPDGSLYQLPAEVVNQKGKSRYSGALGGMAGGGAGDSGAEPGPIPAPPPTPTPPYRTLPGTSSALRLLPHFFGGTAGGQAGLVGGGNGLFGTLSGYAGMFASDLGHIHTGYSKGGFMDHALHSAGLIATIGAGGGVVVSNAQNESDLNGNGQAIILSTPSAWGGELDLSSNQNGQLVYSLSVTYGKSFGAGIVTLPIQTRPGPTLPSPYGKF